MAKKVIIEDFDNIENIFEDESLQALTDKLEGIFIDSDEESAGIEVECGDISIDGKAEKIIPSGCPLMTKAKNDKISLEQIAETEGAAYCDECEKIACIKDDLTCKYFNGVKECQVICKYKE